MRHEEKMFFILVVSPFIRIFANKENEGSAQRKGYDNLNHVKVWFDFEI